VVSEGAVAQSGVSTEPSQRCVIRFAEGGDTCMPPPSSLQSDVRIGSNVVSEGRLRTVDRDQQDRASIEEPIREWSSPPSTGSTTRGLQYNPPRHQSGQGKSDRVREFPPCPYESMTTTCHTAIVAIVPATMPNRR